MGPNRLGTDLNHSGTPITSWQSLRPSERPPVLLRREEVSAQQLRDDLLSMLVAGHETTGSALTWTMYLLAQNPDKMAKVCRALKLLGLDANLAAVRWLQGDLDTSFLHCWVSEPTSIYATFVYRDVHAMCYMRCIL